ncbi:MAG: type II secretion system protein GspN [Nitrospiraceae bacterium]|nr:type II secretion system protein GspN [Nitrospiraceae bacterium]
MKKILIILVVLLLLPSLLWYAAVPDNAITYLIASRAENLGLDVEVKNFHKGPLLNFAADAVSAEADGKRALAFEDVRGRLNPLSLFLFRLRISFKAKLARGSASGVYSYGLFSGRSRLAAELKDVQISELPPVKKPVMGNLGASVTFTGGPAGNGGPGGGRGSLIFSLKDLKHFPYGFKTANGVLDITPAGIRVKSVSLDSAEVYAKLKGDLQNGIYNIRLEITSANPNPLLSRYQVSPGYYVIPLSGRLRQLL